jgi:hypothetical protein
VFEIVWVAASKAAFFSRALHAGVVHADADAAV